MEISLIWWNTSLSPPCGKNKTDSDKRVVFDLIDFFLTGIDMLCLREVSSEDIGLIRQNCDLSGFDVYDGTSKAGKSRFDTRVIYREEKLSCINDERIIAPRGNRTLAFLGRSEWRLNEPMAQILDISAYTSLAVNHKDVFDHLPVMAVIEREN